MAGRRSAARERSAGHRDGRLPASEFFDDAGIGVDAGRGEECAVLDRVRPAAHRIGDARAAVGVRGDPEPVGMGLAGDGGDLSTGVLRFAGSQGGRHVAAGHHDLDDINAMNHAIAHCLADALRSVGLTAQEPAVPARHGDRRARRDDTRADLPAAAEPVPQREGQVVPVSEVPDRGDPGREGTARRQSHPQQQRGVVIGLETGHRVAGGVKRQMLVHVDQARQQRDITKVENIRPGDRRAMLPHTDDPAIRHLDNRVSQDLRRPAIEQSPCRDEH